MTLRIILHIPKAPLDGMLWALVMYLYVASPIRLIRNAIFSFLIADIPEEEETCDLFEGDSVILEILIIAAFTFAVTITIVILVCVCIYYIKGNKHAERKGDSSYKLKDYKI